MSRQRFDLHTHSTASDGILPPREVVALAAERGLAGIALTDHDTVDGIAEAQGMAQSLGIRCLAGVELSCFGPTTREIHILGYLIDPEDAGLAALFAEMRAQRVERATAIAGRINEIAGVLTMDDVLAESGGAPPGRPHIARAMVQLGLIDEIDQAFTADWFGSGGRAFVDREGLSLERGIKAIHDAGGLAVYAHPGARTRYGLPEDSIRNAAKLGLDGIEVDHPGHDGDVVRRCAELATELKLVQTAGSDDHGHGPDGSRLGCRTVPGRIVAALDARAEARRSGVLQ
ncbi:MAG: PHP domain-containing protein [Gaiellales bacterium]